MRTTIKPKEFQTVPDICLQETGTIESMFAFALANDIAITDELDPQREYNNVDLTDESVPRNPEVMALIEKYNRLNPDHPYAPASALNDEEQDFVRTKEGIGYWVIGRDFVVS